jgi:hypothetical protein
VDSRSWYDGAPALSVTTIVVALESHFIQPITEHFLELARMGN